MEAKLVAWSDQQREEEAERRLHLPKEGLIAGGG